MVDRSNIPDAALTPGAIALRNLFHAGSTMPVPPEGVPSTAVRFDQLVAERQEVWLARAAAVVVPVLRELGWSPPGEQR